jgi:hypothetical protein
MRAAARAGGGARAYLFKPGDLDKLVATVGRFVGRDDGEVH